EIFSLICLLVMLDVHAGILGKAVRLGTPGAITGNNNFAWSLGTSPLYEFLVPQGGGILARNRRSIELATNASMTQEDRGWYGYRGSVDQSNWQQIWTVLTPVGRRAWMVGLVRMLVASALVLLATVWIGAWRVRISWQD